MTEDSVEFDLGTDQVDKVLAIAQENGMWAGNVLSSSKEQDARNFVNNAIRAVRAGAKGNPLVLQVLEVAGVTIDGVDLSAPIPVPVVPEDQPRLSKDQVVALLATGTALGISNDDVVTIAGIPLREVNASDFGNLLAAIMAAGAANDGHSSPSYEELAESRTAEPEKKPETFTEILESNAFVHAQVEGSVSGADIKALKQLAEQVIDLETVQNFAKDNYGGKDIEELNRTQFNTIYKMLCEAGSIDYPDDDVSQQEEPPFEPDPPKAEQPASEPARGEKGNRRRTRASDGTLHFKDELEAYEHSLLVEKNLDDPPPHADPEYIHGAVVIDDEAAEEEGNGETMVSEGGPDPDPDTHPYSEGVPAPYVPPIDQRKGSLMEEYKAKREMAIAQARKDNLPIPPDIEDKPEPLPADFTTLSGAEVRRFHSLYHSYLSRASYLLACEESDLDAAHHIYQDHYNRALRSHLGAEAKDTKVTVAKTAASLDNDVVEWREKEASHQTNVRLLKQLRDYYDSSCARLSREASMRQAEMEGTPRNG